MTGEQWFVCLLPAILTLLAVIYQAGKARGRFDEHERRIGILEVAQRQSLSDVSQGLSDLKVAVAEIRQRLDEFTRRG